MIRKYLSVLIFAFLAISDLQAQEAPRKTEFKGKSYYVYPYKMTSSSNNYYYDERVTYYGSYSNYNEYNVVPYPGNLPDGEYVMYYDPIPVWKKKMWFFHRRGEYTYDTTKIAAIFHLKNNQKEGDAEFFDEYDSRSLQTGNYQNNLREGIWKHNSHTNTISSASFPGDGINNDYFYHYDSIVIEIEYHEGIKQGSIKKYSKSTPGLVYCTGQYADNEISGDWKEYYHNGQLAKSYTVTDSLNTDWAGDYMTDSYRYYGGDAVNYHGWLNVYYPNGQLLTRKRYEYGKLMQNDTGYYENGKAYWLNTKVEISVDSISWYRYETKNYDTLGLLIQHQGVERGNNIFTRYYTSGVLYSENYSDGYYSHIKNRDTLVVMNSYYGDEKNNGIPGTTTYKHLKTGATMTRDLDKNEDYQNQYADMNDFNFKSDTVSDIYYLEEIDHCGKNGEFIIHSYKHYYQNPLYYNYNGWYTYDLDSTVVMVDGKRFTGKYVEKQLRKYRKTGRVKLKNDKIIYNTYSYDNNYGGTPVFGYSSKKFVVYEGRYRRFRLNLKRNLLRTTEGNYVNGCKDGKWEERKKRNGKVLDITHYSNGNLNGMTTSYLIEYVNQWSDCKKIEDKKISHKTGLNRKGRYYLYYKANYSNNQLEGTTLRYFCNGKLEEKKEYKDGELHGVWEVYDTDGNLIKKTSGHEGYFDGPYKEWGFFSRLRYDCVYEDGRLTGEFKYYFTNGKMQQTGFLMGGYKNGEWLTYFDDGQIKYKETYTIGDSTYFSLSPTLYSGNVRGPERYLHSMSTCYSVQFYPSGAIASEGRIERNSRKGLWKFYDEGGNLIKRITYEYGKITQQGANGKTDTLHHYGYYESFYQNGTKQSEAYVLQETTSYDCYQEVNIPLQDLYYINFWDRDGNQTVKDKTGRLQTYHLTTGKPESEGEMINGKRTGYWRFWDPEGKLNEVGNYENGLRNGKWLSGDLEGMHYLDDACFDISDPRVIEEMEEKKKKLFITELFYKKGELIGSNNYQVDLNR